MGRSIPVTVVCCLCGMESHHFVLSSLYSSGSIDLDSRPHGVGTAGLKHGIQQCPGCGFCAPDISEPSEGVNKASLDDRYRAILDDERMPETARWYLAHAHLIADKDPREAGIDCLSAAWICDDAGEGKGAAECRTQCVAALRRLMPFEDSEEGTSTGTILVDVLRRLGRFEEALQLCDQMRAYSSITDTLRSVLSQERRLIQALNTEAHVMEDHS